MLTWDTERLSFWGIDLHLRRRRRQVVILTYVAYGMAMLASTQFNAYYGGFWLMCAGSLWMVKVQCVSRGWPGKAV